MLASPPLASDVAPTASQRMLDCAAPAVSTTAAVSSVPPMPTAAAASVATQPPAPAEQRAPTRNLDDIDMTRWILLLSATIACRVVVQHPFLVVLAKKQASTTDVKASELVKKMWKEGGRRCFYRGMPATMAGMLLTESMYLALYESGRGGGDETGASSVVSGDVVATNGGGAGWSIPQPLRDATAAFLSDGFTTVLNNPFAVVAARQMTAGYGLCKRVKYESSASVIRHVYSRNGVHGLFRGLSASLLLAPCSALWWALYHPTKDRLYRHAPAWLVAAAPSSNSVDGSSSSSPQVVDSFVLNAVAGYLTSVVVMTLCNPLMVIRLRMQVLSDKPPPPTRKLVTHVAGPRTIPPPPRSPSPGDAPPGAFSNFATDQSLHSHHQQMGGGSASGSGGSSSTQHHPGHTPGMTPNNQSQTTASQHQQQKLKKPRLPVTIWNVASKIWRKEGWRGMFRGTSLNVTSAAVDGVLLAVTYEATKYYASV